MTTNQTTRLFTALFLFPSLASSSPEPICSSTTYPDFCSSNLPHGDPHLSVFDYAKISIKQSLSHAQNFHLLIQYYLTQHPISSPRYSMSLEDCEFLATLNVDFFSRTLETLNSNAKLDTSQVDDLHTLLSATLTNLQTCFDGLVEAAGQLSNPHLANDLMMSPFFSNGTKFYSVSLAIFKHAWVDAKKNTLPNWVVDRNTLLSKVARDRNLLQVGEGDAFASQSVVVSPDGSGDFVTISEAVAAAAENKLASSSNSYYLIYVNQGIYTEYVSIPKYLTNLILIGAGVNKTVITGNRSVGGNWTTFDSATFAVNGERFVAINITFRNTAGAINGQAVALRSGADLSAFYLCSFEGYQDTLYTNSMRQFYRECDIYGTVDFIFGNAAVVFQKCNIYARQPLIGQANMVTAQGRTDPNQNTGISIHKCSIRAANDLIGSNYSVETYLGRPWKEYSRTVYMLSFMDSFINPVGWSEWDGHFALDTLYYAEYQNSGPGSRTSKRITWAGYHVINSTYAAKFTVANFIAGNMWLPPLVPYVAGLQN